VRVEVEHLPESQVQLQIEIDPEMLSQASGRAYQRLAGKYRVPGFRPGKAPRAVLERAIGPEALLSEATDIALNDAYAQAIKDYDLHPLGSPEVESPKAEDTSPDKPLSFTAKVYVRPEVQLGDYQALRLPPEVPQLGPDEVDRFLANLQEEQAPWKVMEDTAAEIGDLLSLRLLATVGEETLIDQDAWEYRLREDEAPTVPIPNLSQRLLGLRTGESKDEMVDLPADYTPAEYAGKPLSLHVEVQRVDRKEKPALDNVFANSLGAFESMEALRETLGRNMQAQAQRQAADAHVDAVVRQVVEQSTVAVPPPLVEEELDEMMRQLQENVERERKISMDTYARILGKTVEELRAEARPTAEQRVRSDLVLDAVAEQEHINAPDAEIESQLHLVASQPMYSSKERRRLLTSENIRQRIARRLRKRYVINRLLEITNPQEPSVEAEEAAPAAADARPADEATQAPATTELQSEQES
jgi:trigger factor